MESSFIYYNKNTGKVLTMGEAKAEFELAKIEKRPTMLAMSLPSHLVIEDGYVKAKNTPTVAELVARSKEQEAKLQQAETIGSLLPPPSVPAPEPLKLEEESRSEAIIDEIVAEVRNEEEAKEQRRNAILDEIISGIKEDEKAQDKILDEIIEQVIAEDKAQKDKQELDAIIQSVIAEDEARKAQEGYTVDSILDEMREQPVPTTEEYDIDSIIAEYGSKATPRFVDVTDTVLGPSLDNQASSFVKTPNASKPNAAGTIKTDIKPQSEGIDDPEYAIKMVNKRQASRQDPAYTSIVKSSVIEGEIVDFERTGERKGIKYDWLVKGIVALAAVSILYSGAKVITNVTSSISSSIKYNNALSQMQEEYDDSLNFVNKNKITLEGTFDSYGHPAFWIDTKGVAQDILSMPDQSYIGSLYLAYNQMGINRENGSYHNWDDTIGYISSLVDEQHPTAFLTTAGCQTFNQFLIQAGYFDPKTNEPSVELFEQAGKAAVVEFANFMQNDNQALGGRQ